MPIRIQVSSNNNGKIPKDNPINFFLGIDDIGFDALHKHLDKLQQMVHDFQRLLQEEETINLTCAHLLYHFGLVRSLTNLIRRPGRDFSNDKLLEINSLDPVSPSTSP